MGIADMLPIIRNVKKWLDDISVADITDLLTSGYLKEEPYFNFWI